jgi:ATP-dependent RNA helicase DDX23/PRP28
MQSIPIGMCHKDLMAIAPTGEGKTLGYLFPIIHFLLPLERLSMANFDEGPYALVLAPTRELAEQIEEEFRRFTKGLGLSSFVGVGGRQFELQAVELSRGCELLVGTPGRVREFVERRQLSLQRLSWCVVDEADKMVSENLSEDLEFILEHSGEQSLLGRKVLSMFSATMVPEVEKLGQQYLAPNYTYITIG